MLSKFSDQGVLVCNDNMKVFVTHHLVQEPPIPHAPMLQVARSVRILVIAVLPAQLAAVTSTLRGAIRRNTLLCSLVAGIPTSKINQLFGIAASVSTYVVGTLLNEVSHLTNLCRICAP